MICPVFTACYLLCCCLLCLHVFLLSCPQFLLFYFLLIASIPLSGWLELEAPLCACGLFTRSTDSPSEVWLARTEKGRNMNEFITPRPSTSTLYSQILPASFSLATHSSTSPSHTFPMVCTVRVSVRVYLSKARGAANTGQRLIFVARPVCVPAACRRLKGQLLLPAPFLHSRASSEPL